MVTFITNSTKKITMWKDNAVVTVARNYETLEPLGRVKRWSAAVKEIVIIPQPKPLVA